MSTTTTVTATDGAACSPATRRFLLGVFLGLALSACGPSQSPPPPAAVGVPPAKPTSDSALVRAGSLVYVAHCQSCHGIDGVGVPDWRKPDAQGFYPPPPLDGSGHAWHHSTRVLTDIVLNGSPPGQGRMPAWRGKLSAQDVTAVIAWMQSLWPDEIYAAWLRMERSEGSTAPP